MLRCDYLIVVILAIYSSGVLSCIDSNLCVSLRFLARVCSFSISLVKFEGNQPH